jgi:hypothetical protein
LAGLLIPSKNNRFSKLSLVVFILALATVSLGQPFGRFGYTEPTSLPGFILHRDGFMASTPGASFFRYQEAYSSYRPTSTSDIEQTAITSTAGLGPRKLKVNLLRPGFALYFETGFYFKLGDKQAPYLSWADGSVGEEVPTPECSWVLVSFRNQQPPMILSFEGAKTSVILTGSPGNWILRSVDTEPNWVRVTEPTGTQPQQTANAADLGLLVRRVTPNLDLWATPAPALKGVDIKSDSTSVIATWHFAKAGAFIPMPPLLASTGGYNATIQSPTRDSGASTEQGPLIASDSPDLTIRFPVQKIEPGRSLLANLQLQKLTAPSSLTDIPSVFRLAFDNLSPSTDRKSRMIANASSSTYFSDASMVPEPFTGQRLLTDATGKGSDVAAAYALLLQCNLSADRSAQDTNSILLSLSLRRDWGTWMPMCGDLDTQRRAAALMSLAYVMDGGDAARLEAAMLETGLCAQRGLQRWQAHRHMATESPFLEPLDDLRTQLFFTKVPLPADAFVQSLLTPVKCKSDAAVTTSMRGTDTVLQWVATDELPTELELFCSGDYHVEKGRNVDSFDLKQTPTGVRLKVMSVDVGPTEVVLKSAKNAPLPPYVVPPPYSEVRR